MSDTKLYPASGFDFKKRPVSYSTMKHILKSPLHFSYNWYEKKAPTPAMIFGNLVDCLLLQPERFKDRFVFGPEVKKSTKEGRVIWESFMETEIANKQSVIKEEDVEKAKKVVEVVKTNPKTQWLYEATNSVQKKLTWTDKKTGIPLIGYLDADAEKNKKAIIWDLKITTDASEEGWMKQAFNMDYHIQAGTYWRGYAQNTGKFPDFYHIVCEDKEPFAVNTFLASNRFLALGKQQYRNALDRIKHCVDKDCFDMGYEFLNEIGYSQLDLPSWALKHLA